MLASLASPETLRHAQYASGNLGKNTLASFLELFALFYFTDVLGLTPGMAGAILLASLVWDGVADPAMGLIADRLRRRLATVQTYLVVGAPLTALAIIALFRAGDIPSDWRAAYVLICLILFRSAYTIVDVPHNSMLVFLSADSRDRTNIASMRIFFSAVGKLAVSLVSVYFLSTTDIDTAASRFSAAAILFALIYLITMANCARSIWDVQIPGRHLAHAPFQLRHLVESVTANRRLMIVFALTATTSLVTPVIGVALIYVAKYGIGQETAGSAAVTAMAIAQALSPLFWSKLANRMNDKARAAQLANGLLLASALLGAFAVATPVAFFGAAGLAGFAFGGIFMLNWSMLPDALTARSSGRQFDISVFGFYSLINKLAHGLSQAFVGVTLAFYGYAADTDVAVSAIGSISDTLMMAPLLGAAVCVGLLRAYRRSA